MKVTLYDGLRENVVAFEPDDHQWYRENGEFLIGYKTGLPVPLDAVFIKRLRGAPASAHGLLFRLMGENLPGSPKFLGYAKDRDSHLYFFENMPAEYRLLEHELTRTDLFRPEVVLAVVNQAARLFRFIFEQRYVYIDFCAKNIMRSRADNQIAFIDLDSSWPIVRLKTQKPRIGAGIEFWGLWNEDLASAELGALENAHKALVLSFAAVWVTGGRACRSAGQIGPCRGYQARA